jgi:dihydrofolate reductase
MITLLAAIGFDNEIGLDNKLLWKIPEDMKFFKDYTTGKTVVMGRKTFESIGRPLPNRNNIVVTQKTISSVTTITSIEDILNLPDDEIVIIGGEQLYNESIDHADKLLITHVYRTFEADKYFPHIDPYVWRPVSIRPSSDENFEYSFVEYARI